MIRFTDDSKRDALRDFERKRKERSRLPKDPVVAYGGTVGAYSEDAVIKLFGENGIRIPCEEFEDVFRSVASGSADCGVLPVENSTTGAVKDVSELLVKYGLQVCAETEVTVNHCLLAYPGTEFEQIEEVHSHQQSLYQCEAFLREHKNWRKIPVLNNAFAAQDVVRERSPKIAAIASRRCGEVYGLTVLEEGINTSGFNATRFIVITRGTAFPPEDRMRKVSLSFGTPHTPGALYKVLGIFEKYALNLCRIESRPTGEANWEYAFFVDFSGHFTDQTLNTAIPELIDATENFRFLGCYEEREKMEQKREGDG